MKARVRLQQPMQPTMRDVALATGVAQATVSRVYHMPQLVNAETRKRVLSAADRLGYVPNSVAGSLAAQRTRLAIAIVPVIEHSTFSTMLHGLSDRLLQEGVETVIAVSGDIDCREEELVRKLLGRRPDAIVLTGTRHSDATRSLLRKSQARVVEVWNLTDKPIDMNVGFSNRDAAVAVTTHLIRSGRKRIAMVCGPRDVNDRARDRYAGFVAAMRAHDLDVDLFAEVSDQAGVHLVGPLIDALMAKDSRLDAIFCSGDAYAMAAAFHCRRRGWAVPGRVAIAGIGDAPMAALMSPALTTAEVPGVEIGIKAAEMLLGAFNGRPPRQRIVDVGFKVIIRESA